MRRIHHPYWLWEDYKNGFYKNPSPKENQINLKKVLGLFESNELTYKYMSIAVNDWVYSCEHNLTNPSINKIAYIGQAACCLFGSVPSLSTMYSWKYLDKNRQIVSDKIAEKVLIEWEQKHALKNTLNHGRVSRIQKGYQMKLLLN